MINDVDDNDIKQLNDADLRELIGKLCEATLNENKIDTMCVTYGGNQDEPDGGVDVRVKSNSIFNDDWSIPRNNTIFQVKKPSMPNSEIKKEMIKNGEVKDSIKELVGLSGAYIIVSSNESLSDKRRNMRIDCMKEILSSVDLDGRVKVDFYDSKRIATWVKQFPSLIIWVNDKLSKRTIGWKTYYNWSNCLEEEKEYILDEEIYLHKNNFQKENQIKIIDGINEIRELLSKERKVIRLAGLSGVGKTRFAQALFDKNIGKNPLNKEEVIYCDIGDLPNPVPVTFIQELILLQKRTILVIDNCDKDLHVNLAKFCCGINSKISLLTIEYDVKEDVDVESYNYYLDTSSDKTIKKLLKRDFDYISESNIDTIVKCSDGNFRIATYLARTIDKSESIVTLKSDDIFKRLFFQNSNENEELLLIGKICSIFISFNIEYDRDDKNNEINIMSRLSNINSINIIRHVEELTKRQIIQKRGNMRAILPHAIANKLADELLSAMPVEFLTEEIKESKRLQLSLLRRLRFLHDKEYSIKIARYYLAKIHFENINDYEMEMLQYIKIIIPEEILNKIEQIRDNTFFSRENNKFGDWIRVLQDIAYEPKLFFRATILIVEFAKNEREGENYNSIRDELSGLFHIMLSGTHAPVEDRISLVNHLVFDEDDKKRKIGIKLIEELLETYSFRGCAIYDSDSRKRDYGYMPKTVAERNKWYINVLKYCEELIKKGVYKEDIKQIIANNFRNLASCGMYYELEKIVENVLKDDTWPQIWISIGVIKHFDTDKIPVDMLKKMNILQEKCFPKSIEDRIKVFLSKGKIIYWNIDDITDNEEKILKELYSLGKDIIVNKEKTENHLLKIDNTCNLYRLSNFVKGLYENNTDSKKIIYFLLDNIEDNNENIYLIMVSYYLAFMHEKNENEVNNILDDIVLSEKYNKYYPRIQFEYQLNKIDIERVQKSLRLNVASIDKYYRIEFALLEVDIKDIIEILKLFPESKDSDVLIINILHNLFWNKRKEAELKKYARKFISSLDYSQRDKYNDHLNYEVGEIVKYAFNKETGKREAKIIYEKIIELIKRKGIFYYNYKHILDELIKLYPIEFLDILYADEEIKDYQLIHFVKGYGHNEDVINLIDDDILIEWMKKNKKQEKISLSITPYESEKNILRWKKVAKYLIENYPEDKLIINNLILGIYPTSWSDKYSDVLERRLNLSEELKKSENMKVKKIGIDLEQKLKNEITKRQIEEEKEQERYNSFE